MQLRDVQYTVTCMHEKHKRRWLKVGSVCVMVAYVLVL